MENKIIPYSLEAEEALLGNLILYQDALRETIEAGIIRDDFYVENHKKIYSLMVSMYENKEKVDTISLITKLKDFELFDKIGGLDYVMKLTESTISSANTKEYIKIIKSKSISRQIIKAGEDISSKAFDGSNSIDEILEDAEKKFQDITRSRSDDSFKTSAEVFDAAMAKIEAIQKAGSTITGVRTYYGDLDRMTAGFQKGDLIILAARPSVGKTALALNFAINAAQSAQGAIAIFSLEMPSEQLAMRMLSAKSKVESQKVRTARISDEEKERLKEASLEFKSQKIYIDDTAGIKMPEIYAKCRKLKNEQDLYLVIVDYIQLIQSTGKAESRTLEVAEISKRLKALARELEVPVIALSQLSRDVEKRNGKPQLSDLRESGSIEQDADLVIFIHRDSIYEKDGEKAKDERQDLEIILAKHRNGPIGTINLAFERSISAFYGIKNDQ